MHHMLCNKDPFLIQLRWYRYRDGYCKESYFWSTSRKIWIEVNDEPTDHGPGFSTFYKSVKAFIETLQWSQWLHTVWNCSNYMWRYFTNWHWIGSQLLMPRSYEAVIGHFTLIGAILEYVSEMPRRDEILPEDPFASKLMRANFNIFIIGPDPTS